jgi:uncharacterized membrane protein YhaH (DUF805 family)
MDWITFKGKLNRKHFIIRVLTICLILIALLYLSSNVIQSYIGIKNYLILKSFIEFTMILLCLPSIVKRLRDIKWPIYFCGLFVLSNIVNLRNFVLIGSSLSPIQTYILISLELITLLILLCLIFKKGQLNYNETN